MGRRWCWALVAGVTLAVTACSGASPAKGTAAAPTTTADPWAVPATITPAYLNRVLAVFDHLEGEADRDARANKAITPRFLQLERSFRSSESEVQLDVDALKTAIAQNFSNALPALGDPADTVSELVTAQPQCVVAAVAHDLSAQAKSPPAFPPWYIATIPGSPNDLNPTHWVLSFDGYRSGGAPDSEKACAP